MACPGLAGSAIGAWHLTFATGVLELAVGQWQHTRRHLVQQVVTVSLMGLWACRTRFLGCIPAFPCKTVGVYMLMLF